MNNEIAGDPQHGLPELQQLSIKAMEEAQTSRPPAIETTPYHTAHVIDQTSAAYNPGLPSRLR